MPGSLFDTNIWIAAVFELHPHHTQARQLLQQGVPSAPCLFCRSTEQSFLRLTSTPAILKIYGADAMTNHDALSTLDELLALPQVREMEEPSGTRELWHRLAVRNTASAKVWMDAYLAAFAISGNLQLVTLDKDFKTYEASGLNLLFLVT